MRAVFSREFRSFFTTPIGYVFLGLSILANNVVFYIGNVLGRSAELTPVYFFMLIINVITVPVLTMRLFADEYRQKTDQLLLTAPVRHMDIVLGKFFAAFGMMLVVLVLTGIYPFIISLYGLPNGAAIMGSYVAILCSSAACIAVGLFVSSLTESQIIAMLGSLGMYLLFFLLYNFVPPSMGWFYQAVGWFSPFSRFDSFLQGIFPLNDILFYVTLTALFLFLTGRVLEKKRWA